MYRKLLNKIINIVKFGYVSRSSSDSGDYPVTQITYLGKTVPVEIISPYGLYSNLAEGTKAVVFNIGSNEENQVAIGFSQNDRFKNLKSGEVVVGNPKTGSYIKFNSDGSVLMQCNGDFDIITNNNVNIKAAQVNLGDSGAKIARLGDEVTVGGDTGTITSAGNNTSI